ncbi:MAG: GDP-mannose 4,6-dehydratase [Endomicrobiaceae bacterium]|jgi:GDPmannose 4,6-dehydratase|nr:GDP-mannose 4,6-dehydratase [Endomicrobiaceae bacterium]MDD3729594.1 GDP-mannose 4,6-dehydratase [Endomicrobiaceae bacterium]MDD4165687.1 GDP-mannose 4,6-dehydratase [Endomicrobiaceae bacterium]
MKKALIIGVNGQDGSYLSDLLLEKDYEVHGIIRRSSSPTLARVRHIVDNCEFDERFFLHFGDLSDALSLIKVIEEVRPDEIYNLAAQSQVYVSFDIPEYTGDVSALGVTRLLEAINISQIKTKYFQACSSEIFGKPSETPQNENTRLNPVNPYGVSKLYAYLMTSVYRSTYGMFNCSGILYNHESPRRAENFVTRKITKSIAKILTKKQDFLYLGNIESKRDWGFAKDYVEAMWLMLQQDKPDDYIIASGQTYSVKDFLVEAFSLVNLDWQKYVKFDQRLLRPKGDFSLFVGDASKARKVLNWKPKTSFKEIVRLMLEADLKSEGVSL